MIELIQMDRRWCVHTLLRYTARLRRPCYCAISSGIREPRSCEVDFITATNAVDVLKSQRAENI